ncbi:4085_t:CDS:2 [Dentiscutata erythropus]|uniref:4085_t:CDS:1 n=1 Tax=Dentiscutata erythropus TaxID=1348616 RepID=A0A9N9IQA6_9GLOM|nr:4085_t:CDS:2 [Dentiscutata erythropus]
MIIKTHWHHIKYDHLYKFHKPRVDHLCFILIKKVLTQQLYQVQLLQQGQYSVPWRKEFKKEWKQHEKQKTQLNNKYFTDPAKQIGEHHEDDYVIESSDDEQDMYESELVYLHKVLDKTKELLEESCTKSKGHL